MEHEDQVKNTNYLNSIWVGFRSFGKATYFGGKLVLTRRRYAWLVIGYRSVSGLEPDLLSCWYLWLILALGMCM